MVKPYREENIELARRLQKVYNITEDDIYSRLPRIVRNNHITQLEYAGSFRQFALKTLREEKCLEELRNFLSCEKSYSSCTAAIKCNDQLSYHTKCLEDHYKNDKVYEELQTRYLRERKITYMIYAIKEIAKENGYDPKNIDEIV